LLAAKIADFEPNIHNLALRGSENRSNLDQLDFSNLEVALDAISLRMLLGSTF
jgi:hypothetical protein